MLFKTFISLMAASSITSAAPLGVSISATVGASTPSSTSSSMTPKQSMAWATFNQIQANEQLTVDNIRATEYAVVNSIMHQNQITFNAIAAARDGRTPVGERSAPVLAADATALTAFKAAAQTAANAAYAQFYTACVAAAAQKTTATTAYHATLTDPLLASSIATAANAASLAISVAATAAAGNDPVCKSANSMMLTTLTTAQTQLITNIMARAITKDQVALAAANQMMASAQAGLTV